MSCVTTRELRQVDVFSDLPLGGNPVAVVHDADGLDETTMRRFAAWTNLSETTFLLAPTTPGADYRVRIFTPSAELPFASHPTLGSAHAWLEAGGVPAAAGTVVQECGAGLVTVRLSSGREPTLAAPTPAAPTLAAPTLAFAAPPLIRDDEPTPAERAAALAALALTEDDVVAMRWCDNGPGWLGVLLPSADAVLGVRPDLARFGDLDIGLIGRHTDADAAALGALVEVRALCPGLGVVEDPVTGSLNASLAQWLIGEGTVPPSYVAAQGTLLGRAGRVHIDRDGDTIWVGGATRTTIAGTVAV